MTKDIKKPGVWMMVRILLMLLIFSFLIAGVLSIFVVQENIYYDTAILPIKGVIVSDDESGWLSQGSISSSQILSQIKQASDTPGLKAVIFEINSPGGSPVATDDISNAIKLLHAKNITTVAYIKDIGASGAYWVASSTEYIIANRMSLLGSIGVYGSYIEWYGLMKDNNVTYRRLVAGQYKDAGSPFRPLSSAEENMMQSKLDKLHEIFISEVALNRNIPVDDVRRLATGELFLGIECIDNKLIDQLGGRNEAIAYVEMQINSTPKIKEFSEDKTFLETIMSAVNKNSFYIGAGIGSSLGGISDGMAGLSSESDNMLATNNPRITT
jgi:protease-4